MNIKKNKTRFIGCTFFILFLTLGFQPVFGWVPIFPRYDGSINITSKPSEEIIKSVEYEGDYISLHWTAIAEDCTPTYALIYLNNVQIANKVWQSGLQLTFNLHDYQGEGKITIVFYADEFGSQEVITASDSCNVYFVYPTIPRPEYPDSCGSSPNLDFQGDFLNLITLDDNNFAEFTVVDGSKATWVQINFDVQDPLSILWLVLELEIVNGPYTWTDLYTTHTPDIGGLESHAADSPYTYCVPVSNLGSTHFVLDFAFLDSGDIIRIDFMRLYSEYPPYPIQP
ncbi:MAG: hypothetical protein K9W44_05580 [Candidatus Lokiarchaeota archaeon]|nr:hypothetical protein [Candidatus Harpocratesius repetitus]